MPRSKNKNNFALYSRKYGLISVGGEGTKQIIGLSMNNLDEMNEDEIKHWSWKEITKMDRDRDSMGCCMITEDKLFIYGGRMETATKDTSIYNFENEEWSKLKTAKYALAKFGFYFDGDTKRVYTAGGSDYFHATAKLCEYYDIYKNNWYRLPNISERAENVALWKNGDMLYCSLQDRIEYYDLREVVNITSYNSGWKVYKYYKDLLEKVTIFSDALNVNHNYL